MRIKSTHTICNDIFKIAYSRYQIIIILSKNFCLSRTHPSWNAIPASTRLADRIREKWNHLANRKRSDPWDKQPLHAKNWLRHSNIPIIGTYRLRKCGATEPNLSAIGRYTREQCMNNADRDPIPGHLAPVQERQAPSLHRDAHTYALTWAK